MPLHRTSPLAQWLGLCPSTAGGPGPVPGWGTKILHARWHNKKNALPYTTKFSVIVFLMYNNGRKCSENITLLNYKYIIISGGKKSANSTIKFLKIFQRYNEGSY